MKNIYLIYACMYLHLESGHLSVLYDLLGDLCQLVESLVVAEEIGSGNGLSKWTNPGVWWPGVVSNHYWLNEQVRISLEVFD